jgi:signal transduction histidine kinase
MSRVKNILKLNLDDLSPPAQILFEDHLKQIVSDTNRLFVRLMVCLYFCGIFVAYFFSPSYWDVEKNSFHIYLDLSVIIGLLFLAPGILFSSYCGRKMCTPHVVACSLMLQTGFIIHLTRGAIETHFLIFAILPVLGFYRDYRVLLTATVVVYLEHICRGIWFPHSVYGGIYGMHLKSIEVEAWLLLEVGFIMYANNKSISEMKEIASNQAALAHAKEFVDQKVLQRTEELTKRTADLEEAIKLRKELESQLIQSQKMESIGQLASGVAHEINTPTQYVGNNISFFQDSFNQLLELRNCYQSVLADLDPEQKKVCLKRIKEVEKQNDIDFLLKEVPLALKQTSVGVNRISEIVRSMKSFAHSGGVKTLIKLQEIVESTLTVSTNEWKYSAKIHVDIPGDFPMIPVIPGEFSQVLLNLIVNASDAIKDAVEAKKYTLGNITISASCVQQNEFAKIIIEDDALGIPSEIKTRIFDPFFTTKDVGKGTGQGLTLAHNIIVQNHNGSLFYETKINEGTKFIIKIPIDPRKLNRPENKSDASSSPFAELGNLHDIAGPGNRDGL